MSQSESRTDGLSHSQTQIWIGQRLHPESPLYNMAFAFLLPAALDAELFARAWRRVADRSDALRTRVMAGDGEARPRLAPSGGATEFLDFRSRSDPEAEFRCWCAERCARPLSPDGSLVDSVLVLLGAECTGWYLNQHHLIADAWSTQLLFRQLGAEYVALEHGGGKVPALADYYPTAVALSSAGRGRAAAAEHWAARRTRPGRRVPLYGRDAEPKDTASHRLTLELDEDRSRALDRLARQEGFLSPSAELSRFTLFATLLVGWLHRVSGRTELCFDAPVAGRPTPEAKRALGLFIEMFPFAATIEPRDSLRSLGAKCLEEAKLFLRHALPGMSAPSGAAASNVVLNFFPAAFGDFAGLPVEVEWVHPGHSDSVHALRLQVHDFAGSGSTTLHFDFNETALPEWLRRRGPEQFERLLTDCLDDPDRPIATIDLRSEEERRSLTAINTADGTPPPDRTVVELFEERAGLEPHQVALRQGSSEMTFDELRRRTAALAAVLEGRGLEPGDRVAIVGRRSPLAVVAILATLRSRGAYLPIEPSVPPVRLQELLADSGARFLLLGEGALHAAFRSGVDALSIDEAIGQGAGKAPNRPGPELDDLAYLMYTSGSTGRPKGVLIEHRGLADYLGWAARQYVRGDRLTFPLFTSLAFDLTVTSLFLPLITGGTLEIYPQPDSPVDTALMDVARADTVDFIKLTPSHLALLARVGLEGSRLRRMVVGGENLATPLAATISAQLHDQIEIYNEYGPTEAVVGCVAHRYDPEADVAASVPIGFPADHVQVAHCRAVPAAAGAAGRAPLPHWRPGAHDEGGRARISRPARSAAQGLRIPGRARGGGGRPPLGERDRAVRRGAPPAAPDHPAGWRAPALCSLRLAFGLPASGLRQRWGVQRLPLLRIDPEARPGLLPDDGRPSHAVRGVRPEQRLRVRLPAAPERRQGQLLCPLPASGDGSLGLCLQPRQRVHLRGRQGEHPAAHWRAWRAGGDGHHAGDERNLPRQPDALLQRLQRLLQDDLHPEYEAGARTRDPDHSHRSVARPDVRDPAE
jgi:non-ribosomal peptide synthetase component F